MGKPTEEPGIATRVGEEPGAAGLLRAKEAGEGRSKSPENRLKTTEGTGKAEQQGFHQITISSCLYSTAFSQLLPTTSIFMHHPWLQGRAVRSMGRLDSGHQIMGGRVPR